jgi:hypothetical protein
MRRLTPILLLAILTLAACAPQAEEGITVVLVADGSQQTLVLSREATVTEVLDRAGITLTELDDVNPPTFTRTEDGMVITVVRVDEEVLVQREIIPFNRTTVRNDNLSFGETRLIQAGVNGEAEVTYRITYRDGVEASRNEVRRVEITPSQDEVVMVGSAGELPTVTINGTLVYVSGGNAWLMQQTSANRRPLTNGGGLDGRVFSLSPDGTSLLFTRNPDWESTTQPTPTADATPSGEDGTPAPTPSPRPTSTPATRADEDDDAEAPFNSLWAILDLSDPTGEAIELNVENALYAEWVPGEEERAFLYSTAEPRPSFPGWQANNDLWRARISATGVVARKEQMLEASSGGIYGWYGTNFSLGPDGDSLAWAQSDAVGTLTSLELDEQTAGSGSADEGPPDAYLRATLLEFSPATLFEDVVWRPGVSWSPDGEFIATTTHSLPLGEEAPEDSPLYDLTVLAANGSLRADVIRQAGMWSLPQYSPLRTTEEDEVIGWLAFLKAVEPLNSAAGRYQLAIADRDGSNQRLVYPPSGEVGLLPQIVSWSPDARQVALIDQGNLFVVDISSGLAQQLSGDGLSSNPRWAP